MNYFSLIGAICMIVFGGFEFVIEGEVDIGLGAIVIGMLLGAREYVTASKNRRPTISLKDFDAEQSELIKENFDKAVSDYYSIEDSQKKIKDSEVIEQLKQMQKVSHSMIMYLEKHPDRVMSANKFITYYQDRAVKIVNDYHELELTGLTTEKVEEQKQKLKELLFSLDAAYSDQFERMLREKMLSTDAEIEVMNQQMDAEGIERKKTFEKRDIPSYGDPNHEFKTDKNEVIEPEIEDDHEWANVSQDKMTNYNTNTLKVKFYNTNQMEKIDRNVIRKRRLTFLTDHERSQAIKQKSIMAILAIFFGSFGAHKFYQRKNFQGFMYLFFFWTTIPMFIGVAEGVRYIFMPLEDFYIQYVDED